MQHIWLATRKTAGCGNNLSDLLPAGPKARLTAMPCLTGKCVHCRHGRTSTLSMAPAYPAANGLGGDAVGEGQVWTPLRHNMGGEYGDEEHVAGLDENRRCCWLHV